MRQAIEAKGCQLLFLPPYFSDLSPIEEAVSQLKAYLIEVMGSTLVGMQTACVIARVRFALLPIPPRASAPTTGKASPKASQRR